MCAIAAPALAASIAESAIAAGVMGTRSDFPVVSPAPVTAQVMKTSQFTDRLSASPWPRVPGKLSDRRMRHHPCP
jgi:hypothetical protein